jgi:small GTP-binding protein
MSSVPEIKVCVIGDTDVGKSSLTKRYIDGKMPDNSTPTIGASFLQKRVKVKGVDISLQIWDTAGQERFRSMAPMYYKQAKAAVCVFDMTNEESFHRLSAWIKDLKQHADPNAVVCIAGNKCDKPNSFDKGQAIKFADANGAKFFATSALTGDGVDELFGSLSSLIVDIYDLKAMVQQDDGLELDLQKKSRGKKAKCC